MSCCGGNNAMQVSCNGCQQGQPIVVNVGPPTMSQNNGCCNDPCANNNPIGSEGSCGPKKRREKRWANCNFLKPCIDGRIYRNGEYLCISYGGHIPGEQFIIGRNLPTATTFAKRRLCQFTPYEYVDPDGCCSADCVFYG